MECHSGSCHGLMNVTDDAGISNVTDHEAYAAFLKESRFWIQRIFVPVVSIVGIIVNGVTILVFSQRRLRSSTNMYLKALAGFDLLYLVCVLILSFYHYPNPHPYTSYYKPYVIFSADFASNVSVWLTAAFTIERFLVVRDPMQHMKFAKARYAKRVIFFIAIFCFFATISTLFESKVVQKLDLQKNVTIILLEPTALGADLRYQKFFYWFTSVTFAFAPFLLIATLNVFLILSLHAARNIRSSLSPAILASELRTTLLLVVIILMFLFCQSPAAIMLIISLSMEIPNNLYRGLNNILVLLVAVNACANFFLYVGLSVKFRRTFVSLLFLQVSRKLSTRSIRSPYGYQLPNCPYG